MSQTIRTNPEVRQLAISVRYSDVRFPDFLVTAIDLGFERWFLEVLKIKGGASANRSAAVVARRTVSFTQAEYALRIFEHIAGALPDATKIDPWIVKRIVAESAKYPWEARDVEDDAFRFAAKLQEEAYAKAGRPMGNLELDKAGV